jgi:hypothetical protein
MVVVVPFVIIVWFMIITTIKTKYNFILHLVLLFSMRYTTRKFAGAALVLSYVACVDAVIPP